VLTSRPLFMYKSLKTLLTGHSVLDKITK
jgi:hypothetical protein